MELKEFIKATITAVAESIDELNQEISEIATVNPKVVRPLDSQAHTDKLINAIKVRSDGYVLDGRFIQDIEFNLAVTETKSNEKGGGVILQVVNAKLKDRKKKEHVNTVKFSIPVAFLK